MKCVKNNIAVLEEKNISGIYKVECIITGCIYIGYSVDLNERYRTYKRGGHYHLKGLFESLRTHGSDNHTFEIIHVVEKEKFTKRELVCELDRLEVEYIKKYNSYYKDNEKGLNRTRGGGVKIGRPTNEERRLKLKESELK